MLKRALKRKFRAELDNDSESSSESDSSDNSDTAEVSHPCGIVFV